MNERRFNESSENELSKKWKKWKKHAKQDYSTPIYTTLNK